MKVTITIDHGGHQEHYSRVSESRWVTPPLCGAFTAAFAVHKDEASAIFDMIKLLAETVHSLGLGELELTPETPDAY